MTSISFKKSHATEAVSYGTPSEAFEERLELHACRPALRNGDRLGDKRTVQKLTLNKAVNIHRQGITRTDEITNTAERVWAIRRQTQFTITSLRSLYRLVTHRGKRMHLCFSDKARSVM